MSKVILGGTLANMCVESHLRDLLEQGFEVAVAKDATATLINFAFLAHAVLSTEDVVKAMK
jgi:nicotinamidase-related amidase